MIITDITQQVKNPKRYSIFLDGKFAFGIDGVDLLEYKLKIGQELSIDEYDTLMGKIEYIAARDAAVKYLSTGLKSVYQLREMLANKEFSNTSTELVVELLISRGYLDDVAYAKSFITHKTRVNNFGRYRIEQELLQKGVLEKDSRRAFEELAQSDGECQQSEHEIAKKALLKKIRNKNIEQISSDDKELQKLRGFLIRRGFDFSLVDKVLDQVLKEK